MVCFKMKNAVLDMIDNLKELSERSNYKDYQTLSQIIELLSKEKEPIDGKLINYFESSNYQEI